MRRLVAICERVLEAHPGDSGAVAAVQKLLLYPPSPPQAGLAAKVQALQDAEQDSFYQLQGTTRRLRKLARADCQAGSLSTLARWWEAACGLSVPCRRVGEFGACHAPGWHMCMHVKLQLASCVLPAVGTSTLHGPACGRLHVRQAKQPELCCSDASEAASTPSMAFATYPVACQYVYHPMCMCHSMTCLCA